MVNLIAYAHSAGPCYRGVGLFSQKAVGNRSLVGTSWEPFVLQNGAPRPFWKPEWVPKGTLQTKEGPRWILEPLERAQGAQGQSVSNVLSTKGGAPESPKGAQGTPKGAQRTPKGSPKDPPKTPFCNLLQNRGPPENHGFIV